MPFAWCGLMIVLALAPTPATRRGHSAQKPSKRIASSKRVLSRATSRTESEKLFEAGLTAFENEHGKLALQDWRSSAQINPKSPLVHLFISLVTTDQQEQRNERRRAQALASRATKRERLLIKWLSGVEEGNYVSAIAAMNDSLAFYPKDKQIAFLAGRWLRGQEQYQQASTLLLRATELDPAYAAAWNQLAYCYAYTGDFSNAFAAMERYTALLPKDPNPQDSYAAILRMAGNFRDALAHYRQALALEPGFQSSQVGIADTYALMGEEGTARAEYEKAFRQAANPSDQIHCAIQSALTYLREKKARRAIAVLDSVASQAHDRRLPLLEAEAFRDMALIERDTQQSLRFLDKASAALAAIPTRSGPELPRERAEVLRVRATSLAGSGNARAAAEALNQLDQLTKTAHDMALDRCYAGAMGSVLVLQQKFDQAIPYLEEDTSNPLSMRDLIVAYTQRRSADRAHVLELKLSALNQPTAEQALVVPDLRARLAATKDKRGWLRRLTGRER